MTRTISFVPAPAPVKVEFRIERGVLYEDPALGRSTLRWFIGTTSSYGTPTLTCLRTGEAFLYANGKLPGELRPVGPGTLTITIEGGTS